MSIPLATVRAATAQLSGIASRELAQPSADDETRFFQAIGMVAATSICARPIEAVAEAFGEPDTATAAAMVRDVLERGDARPWIRELVWSAVARAQRIARQRRQRA